MLASDLNWYPFVQLTRSSIYLCCMLHCSSSCVLFSGYLLWKKGGWDSTWKRMFNSRTLCILRCKRALRAILLECHSVPVVSYLEGRGGGENCVICKSTNSPNINRECDILNHLFRFPAVGVCGDGVVHHVPVPARSSHNAAKVGRTRLTEIIVE